MSDESSIEISAKPLSTIQTNVRKRTCCSKILSCTSHSPRDRKHLNRPCTAEFFIINNNVLITLNNETKETTIHKHREREREQSEHRRDFKWYYCRVKNHPFFVVNFFVIILSCFFLGDFFRVKIFSWKTVAHKGTLSLVGRDSKKNLRKKSSVQSRSPKQKSQAEVPSRSPWRVFIEKSHRYRK